MADLILRPITLRAANAYVLEHHRHNKPTRGHKFSLAAHARGELVGVVIVGRPVARGLDDGMTIEVLRLCVAPGAPRNTCSFLYGAARRVWGTMGGGKCITYTLQSESGESLRGAGWVEEERLAARVGENWTNRGQGRVDQAVVREPKIRWASP